jgi:Fe-S cluster biosynthesis and repair protein YggX
MKKDIEFLKSLELPTFLYEDEGEIKVGFHGDSVCTEDWLEWLAKVALIINEKP